MTYKMIQVGTGGFGAHWCQHVLPSKIASGLLDVVAAVDINPDALGNARRYLGLPADRCYVDYQEAFARHTADLCSIVVPPAFHEDVVDAALEHDLHILSEKPIADSLAGSIRIANKVKRAGKRMAVTMSHRFDADKTTLREVVRQQGSLDYIVSRITNDARRFGAWGRYRHEMADPLINETAYHHLDIVADLAGARCETVYAQTWNPPWGEFQGHSQGLVTLRFENGTHATYEGAMSNAVGLNGSPTMYIRAECQDATIILNRRRVERFPYDPGRSFAAHAEGTGEEIPLLERSAWSHAWLIDQFVEWLDGGLPVPTNVEENLQTAAMVFSAIESSHSGQPVQVQEFLRKAQEAEASRFQGRGLPG